MLGGGPVIGKMSMVLEYVEREGGPVGGEKQMFHPSNGLHSCLLIVLTSSLTYSTQED